MKNDYILFEDIVTKSKEDPAAISITDAIKADLVGMRNKKSCFRIERKEVLYYLDTIYSRAEIAELNKDVLVEKCFDLLMILRIYPQLKLSVEGKKEMERQKIVAVTLRLSYHE